MTHSQSVEIIYGKLLHHYGRQQWWPAKSKLEIMIGAILTQNTSWQNVETVLEILIESNMLSCKKIISSSDEKFAALIRPAGLHNVKTQRIKSLANFILAACNDNVFELQTWDTIVLRKSLINVHGIGPETADDILLYALNKPFFVIDNYTRRMMRRIGIFPTNNTYDSWQAVFENAITKNTQTYKEYHALIVENCKLHCAKSPSCEGCPLHGICDYASNHIA